MKYLVLALCVLVLGSFVPKMSYAGNSSCAIWLCLPTGFPSGCGSAKRAFKKRILRGKSPLPSLSSCMVSSPIKITNPNLDSSSNMTSKDGVAALIRAHKICEKQIYDRDKEGYVCTKWKQIKQHAIHDERCVLLNKRRDRLPHHCIKTIRYIQTFMDGIQYGETYYFDSRGKKIEI